MKSAIALLALLTLFGCSDSTKEENTPSQSTQSVQPIPEEKPVQITETKDVAPLEKANETTPPPVTTSETAEVKTEESTPATTVAAPNGRTLFDRCMACHGTNAEKPALGKSQIIGEWDAQRIVDALKGYQAGTYGGSMKALMQGQIKDFSDAEIEAVAKYIESL